MDTFFATKKGGQPTRGHVCCQLFVTDNGFLYAMPMRRKSEVHQAIKQFAKEIGAPTSIIADMAGEQMSQEAVTTLEQPYGHYKKAPHRPIKLNCTLESSRRQSERTCVNLTP